MSRKRIAVATTRVTAALGVAAAVTLLIERGQAR